MKAGFSESVFRYSFQTA